MIGLKPQPLPSTWPLTSAPGGPCGQPASSHIQHMLQYGTYAAPVQPHAAPMQPNAAPVQPNAAPVRPLCCQMQPLCSQIASLCNQIQPLWSQMWPPWDPKWDPKAPIGHPKEPQGCNQEPMGPQIAPKGVQWEALWELRVPKCQIKVKSMHPRDSKKEPALAWGGRRQRRSL